MKINLLLCLILFTAKTLYAQQSWIYDLPQKFEKIEGQSLGDYIFLKGETREHTLFYIFHLPTTSKEVYVYDELDINIVGHAVIEQQLNIYFSLRQVITKNIYCLTYSFNTKKFSSPVKIDESRARNDIAYLSLGKEFCILSNDKNNQSLILQKYKTDKLIYQFPFLIENKEVFKFFKNDEFVFIPENGNVSYTTCSSNKKIYIQGGNLIAVIDDPKVDSTLSQTALVKIDTTEKLISTAFFNLPFHARTKHNSFLHNGQLFVFGIDDDFFRLRIFDTETLQLLKDYNYFKETKITLKRSELLKSTTGQHDISFDDQWKGKWNETSINKNTIKVLKGSPVIHVSSADESTLRLLIGNRSEMSSSGLPATPTFTGLPGFALAPPYSFFAVDGLEERVFFYGYLNNDLTISDKNFPNHGPLRLADKRVQYLRKTIRLGAFSVMGTDDVYLVYIDKKLRTVNIEIFTK